MTTYSENLEFTEQGEIVELYVFEYGGVIERFTSFNEDIVFEGQTYSRATIRRTGFSQDTEFGRVTCSVQAPLLDSLKSYIANQPIEVTRITIYRALLSDTDEYRALFKGDIIRVSVKDSVAQASCESQSHILMQKIPNIIYQSYCNHQVFDGGCGLIDGGWRDDITINVISGSKYSSSNFGSKPDDYYTGGQLIHDNDARYITKHTGADVWVHVPFDSRVSVGTELYAIPGCDGSPDTCKNKFSNFSNWLGFPYIPSSNPVMWGFK
jgi:uncharacterized phage protein (TIGR02218 family)